MILKIREQDIVVEFIPVHAYKIEEHEVVVSVAMDYDCGALGVVRVLCRYVAGVDVLVVPAGSPDVLKDALGLEAVVPGR